MAPDFGPLFVGLGTVCRGFAEGVSRGLVVLLVKKGFTHAEVGQRAIRLNGESDVVLGNRVVVSALFGKFFATSNGGASAQPGAAFEDDVIGIDLDAARFGASEGLYGEG